MARRLTQEEIETNIDEILESVGNGGDFCESLRNLDSLRHNLRHKRNGNAFDIATQIVALVADISAELLELSEIIRFEEDIAIGINYAIDTLIQWDYHLIAIEHNLYDSDQVGSGSD